MAHINVKPLHRLSTYATAERAILHLFIYNVSSLEWDYGCDPAHGRNDPERRRINAAMAARDPSAFKASQRRGYWRVELAEPGNLNR